MPTYANSAHAPKNTTPAEASERITQLQYFLQPSLRTSENSVSSELRRITLPRALLKRRGRRSGRRLELGEAAPFWFDYSAVASSGAFEECAFRLSSATPKASSSKLDSCAMFHT